GPGLGDAIEELLLHFERASGADGALDSRDLQVTRRSIASCDVYNCTPPSRRVRAPLLPKARSLMARSTSVRLTVENCGSRETAPFGFPIPAGPAGRTKIRPALARFLKCPCSKVRPLPRVPRV